MLQVDEVTLQVDEVAFQVDEVALQVVQIVKLFLSLIIGNVIIDFENSIKGKTL
jgi:hypothetical protein